RLRGSEAPRERAARGKCAGIRGSGRRPRRMRETGCPRRDSPPPTQTRSRAESRVRRGAKTRKVENLATAELRGSMEAPPRSAAKARAERAAQSYRNSGARRRIPEQGTTPVRARTRVVRRCARAPGYSGVESKRK